MSKRTSITSESKESLPIPLHVPNILGYIRFVAIIASWPFALSLPETFVGLYLLAQSLGVMQNILAKSLGQESFYGTQLDILMSRFATSSLIFVVIKSGISTFPIEEERMQFTFLFGCLFLSDFVSYWFQVYSAYLLDEEPHKSPNATL